MPGPLSSLKILDFSTLLPGPFASMMLADMGADVLRIEAPNRPDIVRLSPPFEDGVSAWHALLNRSKRSLALDLKKSGSTEIIQRLVKSYDIVLEQFRPGVMDRLGVGYETLRQTNPGLIYCAITGYGQSGPYKDRAGHDNNYLALAGVMSHMGRREGGPLPLSLQVADVGGGSFGAVTGILAAVVHRQLTGEGQLVDVSMFDMAVSWNSLAASHYFVSGENPKREVGWLNGGSYYDFYRTADDRYLSVGSLEPKFWAGFCQAIDRPDLISQGLSREANGQQSLKAEIGRIIAAKPLAEWMTQFAQLDVCVEPVLTVSEMAAHPQTKARQMIAAVPKPDGTIQKQVAAPIKFSQGQAHYAHIGAQMGAHTAEVLSELGYSLAEIQKMQAEGLFGDIKSS